MTFEDYWAFLESAGWFRAYKPATVVTFRERLERAWARDPAYSVYELGLPCYDSEWVAERADFCALALDSYARVSDGHFRAEDVQFERAGPQARLSFSIDGRRVRREFSRDAFEMERTLEAMCNEALELSGSRFRFYSVPSPDQCHYVVLTTPEAFAAIRAREWLSVQALPGGRWGAILDGGRASDRLLAFARERGQAPVSLFETLAAHATSPDAVVREWVAEALEGVDDDRVAGLALDLLLDPDWHVRAKARKSLDARPNVREHPGFREAWERIDRAMADGDSNRRVAATELLAELGEPSIPRLIPCLLDPHSAVKSAADKALRSLDREWAKRPSAREAVPALIAALRDPERGEVRRYVVATLGKIGDRRAIGALVDSLCDEHGDGWTLAALDEIDPEWPQDPGARTAAPLLLGAASGKGTSPPDRFAIEALSRVAGDEHTLLYLRLLSDSSPFVVAAAAAALGRIRASVAMEPLLSLLTHEHHYVRRSAATALGEIGNGSAVPALEAIRKDRDFQVREAVIEALRRCNAEGAPSD